jgi:hypothetical protein
MRSVRGGHLEDGSSICAVCVKQVNDVVRSLSPLLDTDKSTSADMGTKINKIDGDTYL